MAQYIVTSSAEADPADIAVIHAGLRSFNDAHAGPAGRRKVHLFARDSAESVIGGLMGSQLWGWLYVETLWVEEASRGRGLGTRLLAQAEAEAMAAGCTRALLDTFEFQALPFYERRGYSVFGVLENFPPGFRRYYLQKPLGA
jgi:GNAT superfamily N-acetyltransferase